MLALKQSGLSAPGVKRGEGDLAICACIIARRNRAADARSILVPKQSQASINNPPNSIIGNQFKINTKHVSLNGPLVRLSIQYLGFFINITYGEAQHLSVP